MPQPASPGVTPQTEPAHPERPRTRRLRRRSDRIIRLVAVMAILGATVISAVMWQQSQTIAKQRALIQLIFQDSLELNKMRQRELQRRQDEKKRNNSGATNAVPGPLADGCVAFTGACG
jgi:hypothetical protein